MRNRALLFLTMILFSQVSFALYGAKPVTGAGFNFVGSLHLRDEDNKEKDFFCSAVLVGPKHVVTAGHCIEGMGRDVYDDAFYLQTNPAFMKVKFGDTLNSVKRVWFTKSYFETSGLQSEDVVLIELTAPVKNVKPVPLYAGNFFPNQKMKLAARGKVAETKLLMAKKYATGALVLTTDGSQSGTCGGDSGGALLTDVPGGVALVGVLTYNGEKMCEKKNTVSYGPRGNFGTND